jgi:hypothetical protein
MKQQFVCDDPCAGDDLGDCSHEADERTRQRENAGYLMSDTEDDDKPGFIAVDGYKAWYHPITRRWHRTNGPARIWKDGREEWYLYGEYIDCKTQEEFEKLMRLKAFW